MHATGATCLRVQGGLEYGTEDSGADKRPIKVIGSALNNQIPDFFIYARNLYVPSEHSTVDIRKCQQFLILVRVSVFRLLIQNVK